MSRYPRMHHSLLPGFLFFSGLLLQPGISYSQLFPGLTGEPLVQALQENFTPVVLLNDAQAKDTLYAKVYRTDDSVRCIYSGMARLLPEGVDPSQYLYGTGQEVFSMNLEHGWPQSKGAGKGTDGNTNMYHLFPSRTEINSIRGDHPFQEIADQQTTRWFYQQDEMSSVPSINIEGYSEYAAGRFEPREHVKGDIARAMFYFWTIYRDDAVDEDPDFFGLQAEYFCDWHYQDPVDEAEIRRNEIIASYQGGKQNPFIVDCSLIMRAYCQDQPECLQVDVGDAHQTKVTLRYNPAERAFYLEGDDTIVQWHITVIDTIGRVYTSTKVEGTTFPGGQSFPPGTYYASARWSGGAVTTGFVIP